MSLLGWVPAVLLLARAMSLLLVQFSSPLSSFDTASAGAHVLIAWLRLEGDIKKMENGVWSGKKETDEVEHDLPACSIAS